MSATGNKDLVERKLMESEEDSLASNKLDEEGTVAQNKRVWFVSFGVAVTGAGATKTNNP